MPKCRALWPRPSPPPPLLWLSFVLLVVCLLVTDGIPTLGAVLTLDRSFARSWALNHVTSSFDRVFSLLLRDEFPLMRPIFSSVTLLSTLSPFFLGCSPLMFLLPLRHGLRIRSVLFVGRFLGLGVSHLLSVGRLLFLFVLVGLSSVCHFSFSSCFRLHCCFCV